MKIRIGILALLAVLALALSHGGSARAQQTCFGANCSSPNPEPSPATGTGNWVRATDSTFSGTTTIGATIIGGSGITGTTVPLTVSRGSSSGNIANFQTTAGTTVSYVNNLGAFLAPSALGYSFAASPTYGLNYNSGTNGIEIKHGANAYFGVNSIVGTGVSTDGISFYTTTVNAGTVDTRLTREAAATLQMGVDVNGAAVNQTLKAHDGITGTDISGANMTIAAGRGTGSGAGGTIAFQTAPVLASGTAAQTLATRMTIQKDGGVTLAGIVFASLGTPADGTLFYCSDCAPTTPFVDSTCASGGTGSLAIRLNGAWKCNN